MKYKVIQDKNADNKNNNVVLANIKITLIGKYRDESNHLPNAAANSLKLHIFSEIESKQFRVINRFVTHIV